MDLSELNDRAVAFRSWLDERKAGIQGVNWYHSPTLENIAHMHRNFTGPGRAAFAGVSGLRVADIGAADGELGFLLEQLGAKISIIDNPPTNYNQFTAAQVLKRRLGSPARLHAMDLDYTTHYPDRYDLAVFLGILYHLRSPALALSVLAMAAERMLVSTVIYTRSVTGEDVSGASQGTLLHPGERNNDPTNWWFFTPHGLETLLSRCGWEVRESFQVGDLDSTPLEGDQRMFCYCERRKDFNLAHQNF
jgi:hypothetical protein